MTPFASCDTLDPSDIEYSAEFLTEFASDKVESNSKLRNTRFRYPFESPRFNYAATFDIFDNLETKKKKKKKKKKTWLNSKRDERERELRVSSHLLKFSTRNL